jgi:AcrR family transcriptional regulator
MARPKDENYDGKKETILKAAARVFADKGFLRTNIIDIGEACGASKSRMYHYFDSKEALLAQLLISNVEALHAQVEAAVADVPPGPVRLRRLIEAHVRQYMESFAEHKLLLAEPNNLRPEDRARLVEREDRLVALTTSVLREVAPVRLAKAADARVHAMLVYGMLNWTFTWYKPGGAVSPQALAERIYGMAMHGLAGSAGAAEGADAGAGARPPDGARGRTSARSRGTRTG